MRDLQLPGPKKMATATLPPPPSLRAYLKGPPAVSMRTLAHKVGVHPSMISMLSSGKRKPGADVLDRLHKVTRVPFDALLHPRKGRKRAF